MGTQLDKFLDGWTEKDMGMMLDACADDFVYDDPYDGRITKAEWPDFFRRIPEGGAEFTDEFTIDDEGGQTDWFWWVWTTEGATEPDQEGSGLAKAGPDGVHSIKFAYYKGTGFFGPA